MKKIPFQTVQTLLISPLSKMIPLRTRHNQMKALPKKIISLQLAALLIKSVISLKTNAKQKKMLGIS
jgi:hypothetical protein